MLEIWWQKEGRIPITLPMNSIRIKSAWSRAFTLGPLKMPIKMDFVARMAMGLTTYFTMVSSLQRVVPSKTASPS